MGLLCVARLRQENLDAAPTLLDAWMTRSSRHCYYDWLTHELPAEFIP